MDLKAKKDLAYICQDLVQKIIPNLQIEICYKRKRRAMIVD